MSEDWYADVMEAKLSEVCTQRDKHANALAVERGKLEKADAENQRLGERVRELEAAVRQSMVAIDDWLHTYAAELCDDERVKEAFDRIAKVGTIGYISQVQQVNHDALMLAGSGGPGAVIPGSIV